MTRAGQVGVREGDRHCKGKAGEHGREGERQWQGQGRKVREEGSGDKWKYSGGGGETPQGMEGLSHYQY
ncbi:hypothetical protein E2C01_101739 [Portunus trituberculatus]|uniref:Uncharacterized protein n=1 Tax=Portunus trituberculatus TaxID=210409 RepID=A0A5B7KGM1_PORTR|nr:hypothetical protein [Portunus trituberculatus]